eukprot:scaffold2298_cov388-Prasinococcus_capsulatus_cf.AAC.8
MPVACARAAAPRHPRFRGNRRGGLALPSTFRGQRPHARLERLELKMCPARAAVPSLGSRIKIGPRPAPRARVQEESLVTPRPSIS